MPAANLAATADARLKQRTVFDFGFSILFLVFLHGYSIIKIFVILYINYKIAKGLPRPYVPIATWSFNLVVMFSNELCGGYPFADVAGYFVSDGSSVFAWAQYLDSYRGLIPRWQILFKFTILRLISFNMDYYWSLNNLSGSPLEVRLPPILSKGTRLPP